MKLAWCLVVLAACAQSDPCEGVAGTCVTLHVSSATVHELDQLEVDILYGDHHATTTTQGTGVTKLPLETAIELGVPGAFAVGVVAAGKLSGNVLGTGAAHAAIADGAHVAFDIVLAAPDACTAGSFYCGGDKVAGDPSTLYQCNGGGVPHARGTCAAACLVRPTLDDACQGVGGTCTDGALYCGGDKLDGDPQTLYRCSAGSGTVMTRCTNGCAVRTGQNDACR